MTEKVTDEAALEERPLERISVRGLVEFILRSGDIDDRTGGMPDTDAMLMGGRIHRKIQARMGPEYQAEVPLSGLFDCGDFLLCLEGRADGIFGPEDGSGMMTVDEIKGVMRRVERLREPVGVHLAQAKCYAYLYLMDRAGYEVIPLTQTDNSARERHGTEPEASVMALPDAGDRIGVRMTYVNLETERTRYFTYDYSLEELSEWIRPVVTQYVKWARFGREWKKIRRESIHSTTFPYPYRDGQKQLAADVYRSIARGKILFIQAPTGTGKTIATIFPAVKAVGEGLGDKIFYLTARTIVRTAALETMALLAGHGLREKTVVLTAKEKICRNGEVRCNPEDCPYAKGHFDRINDALYELITTKDLFTREVIEEAADHYQVCPFELSLDLSMWMDMIIGDYNYAFAPRARLRRFFGENVKGDYIFLIDEAHNLIERGRDMFSASLVREDLLALRRLVKDVSPRLARSLQRCSRDMLHLQRQNEPPQVLESLGTLPASLLNLSGIMEDLLSPHHDDETAEGQEPGVQSNGKKGKGRKAKGKKEREQAQAHGVWKQALLWEQPVTVDASVTEAAGGGTVEAAPAEDPVAPAWVNEAEIRDAVRDLYFEVSFFLEVCDLLDEHYVIYDELTEEGDFRIRLYNVDPSANLQECMDKARSSILFSATLLPIDYYKSLLSTRTDNYAVYADSCFDPAHRQVLIGTDVSSRYTRRNEQEYGKIARYIRLFTGAREGNYLIFFPSYRMMEDVLEQLMIIWPQAQIERCQETRRKRKDQQAAGIDGITETTAVAGALADSNAASDAVPGSAAASDAPDPVCDRILVQTSRMTESEREAYLEHFTEEGQGRLLGLCVMGSIFSEGIDLKRDRLIGAVVVGTGLPMVSTERDVLRQYFDGREQDGFRYAYLCPGMNKVMQAAGRVIRTEEDRGSILLLDERFARAQYRSMFPREWNRVEYCSLRDVEEKVRRFWDEPANGSQSEE